MPLDQPANFVRVEVTDVIASGDTTISVGDASAFPDPDSPPTGLRGAYNCVVWDGDGDYPRPDQDPDREIVRVTGRDTTSDTLTVQRGREGTTAAAHPDTAVIIKTETANTFSTINGDIRKLNTELRPSVNDLYIQTARQDFELGLTQLDYGGGQYEIYVDDSQIDTFTGVGASYGSPLNNAGFVYLLNMLVGSISTEQDSFTGHGSSVGDIDIFDGFGYSASGDETVRKWDIETMSEQDSYTGHGISIRAVAIDGDFGYSGGGGTIKKWDTETMSEQGSYTDHSSWVEAITIDGNFGYSASADNTVRKWDTETMAHHDSFGDHSSTVYTVAIDGDFGYSGGGGTIKKWDTETMTQQDQFSGHSDYVKSIVIDGDFGYSSSDGGPVRKWDKETMTQVGEYQGPSNSSFNTDTVAIEGDFGYSGSADDTVYKWDKETMTGVDTFTGHTARITSIAVPTDGGYGYSGSSDGTVRKWGEGIPATTNGSVEHTATDMGFVPSSAVISDDLRSFPETTTVYYEIADDAGNSVTIQRSDIDSEVDVSALSSSVVSTTAFLERPNGDTESPELDAWALYLS